MPRRFASADTRARPTVHGTPSRRARARGTISHSVSNVLVEEWDGYTWRRILGNGPLPYLSSLLKEMAVAREVGHSPSQVAINWVRQQSPNIIPILGARREAQILDNLGVLDFDDQIARKICGDPLLIEPD